jgi:excisionase family DNA binding protein
MILEVVDEVVLPERMYTIDQVAEHLGRCHRNTVKRLIKTGQLSSVRIGSLRRIKASQLQAYIDSLKPEPADEAVA